MNSPSPHFNGFDHLAIAVPDTEEALKIWRDVYGFPVVCSEAVNDGTVLLTHLDMGNVKLQLVQPLHDDHPLAKQLDEQKSRLDDETRSRSKLASENRALQQEMTSLQEALEDEADGRSQLQKMLAKANGDAQAWRRKFEGGEGAVKAEEAR